MQTKYSHNFTCMLAVFSNMYTKISGSSDILMENGILTLEAMGDPRNFVVTFLMDAVAQETNETFSLELVPTFSTLQTLPNGEAVFFRNFINLTIIDSDCKRLVRYLVLYLISILSTFNRCRDSIY